MITKDVVAIIPARSGSKGVPQKNVRLVAEYPILAYSIIAAKLAPSISRVLLSTDSAEYAELGRRFGAEAPFLRPEPLAGDKSTDRDFFLHAMHWLDENEGAVPEWWIHLRPTTPLRDPTHIEAAIRTIQSRPDATALRSGHPASESPFKWFSRDEDGYFRGIRPHDPRPEYYNLPRQAFEAVYVPDGYVDIVRASQVLNSPSLHGNQMLGFESPPCIEVDTLSDFDRLEYELQRHGSPLLDYLKQHYPAFET